MLKSPERNVALKLERFEKTFFKNEENENAKCGSMGYYLLTDLLGFQQHDLVESDEDAFAYINGYDHGIWQPYVLRLIDRLGDNAEEVLGYPTNGTIYAKFKAAYSLIQHNAKIFGDDPFQDAQIIGALMNTIYYLPTIRTNWWSIEALHDEHTCTSVTDEHYYPRKLSIDRLLIQAAQGVLDFEDFVDDAITKYIRIHSVTSRENDILSGQSGNNPFGGYQCKNKWVDTLNTFHPDIPYILASVRLVDRDTKRFKPVDPEVMEVLPYVKGIDASRFVNYDDQLVVYSQFGLELPDDYERDSTEFNRHVLPIIAFIEDYFEPGPESKVVLTDLAEAYRSRYFDIHDATFSRIMGMWSGQFTKTSFRGKSAFAGLRPKAQHRGLVDVQTYNPPVSSTKDSEEEHTFEFELGGQVIRGRGIPAKEADFRKKYGELAEDTQEAVRVAPDFDWKAFRIFVTESFAGRNTDFLPTHDLYEELAKRTPFKLRSFHFVSRFISKAADKVGLERSRSSVDGTQYRGWSLK